MGEEKKGGDMGEFSGLVKNIKDLTQNIKDLTQKKKFTEAIKILESLRESGAMKLKDRVVLGELYAEVSDWSSAENVMKEVLKEDPECRKAYAVLEKLDEHITDKERNINFFQELVSHQSLRDKSIKTKILLKLLNLYREKDDRKALLPVKEALYNLEPGNRSYQISLCEEYMLHMERDEKALEVYEKTYRQNPKNSILRKHLCAAYRELQKDRWRNLDICLQHFAEEPNDLENVRYLATAFMKKDEYIDEKIEVIYTLCLQKGFLDSGSLLFHRGLYFEKRKELSKAIENYEESFKDGYGEKDHYPLQRLAFLYEAQREREKAREYYLKQFELYPEDEITRFELQRILLAHDVLTSLDCEELVTASELLTSRTSSKACLAVANRLIDTCRDYKTALHCFDMALSRDPSNINALEGKKTCLVNLRRFEEAAETLEKKTSLKLLEDNAVQSLIELAGLYRDSLNSFEKAESALTKALSIDSKNYQCHYMRIQLYKASGDDQKFHESLRESWRIFPVDEKILRDLRDYYGKKKHSGALYVIDEILFLTGRGAKPPRYGVEVPGKAEEYMDERDKKGHEKIRFYLNTLDSLKIKTCEIKSDSELESIRAQLKELAPDDEALLKKLVDLSSPLLGVQDIRLYACEGDEAPFKVRTMADVDEKLLIIAPPFFKMLPEDIELALVAQALAHHRFEHTKLYRSIRILNAVIIEYIDRLVRYVETSLKGSSDYLRAPLLFLVSQLKQEKMRKKIFEKILTHIESFIHHPLLVDLIKDTSSLVLFQEGSVNEFEKGAAYSSDNVAYGITKDLSAATAAALYDGAEDLRDTELTAEKRMELITSSLIRERVTHLWGFALDCALKEKAAV
ncbi:MAG: tetratricopeptide repeat protein [Vulcanimicrobiota bacterium]